MAAQVHLYPKIERQLADMMRQSNGRTDAPAIAAQRAREIIGRLVKGIPPAKCGLMSHRGDRRVKNSLKFNLGSGFRLICIKQRPDIHVMFAGDHDSCDAWLDHHTSKKPLTSPIQAEAFSIAAACAAHDNETNLSNRDKTIDEDPFPFEISQKDLRRIFSGLCSTG